MADHHHAQTAALGDVDHLLLRGPPEDRQAVRTTLEHWQRDADLTAVRDEDTLQKLSAEEQEAWRKLWGDVSELLKKAGNAK